MGFFDFLKPRDINAGVAQFETTEGALLLDVRGADEYAAGHIPGSRNLPLPRLERISELAAPGTPLFVYCLSGGRSRQAASILKGKGYTVTDLGGISAWKGRVVK